MSGFPDSDSVKKDVLDRRTAKRYSINKDAILNLHKEGDDSKIDSIPVFISDISIKGAKIKNNFEIDSLKKYKKLELELSELNHDSTSLKFDAKIEHKISCSDNVILLFKNSHKKNAKTIEASLKRFSYNERREVKDRRKNKQNNKMDKRKTDRRLEKPLFLKCVRYNRMDKLRKENKYFYLREFQSKTSHRIMRNGRELVMFGSNNYLDLASHPEVQEAMIKTAEKYCVGSGGSRVLCGTMDLHNELERKLAQFIGGEDSIVYSIGYGANVGLLSALLGKNDHVLTDINSHASIFDGIILSGAGTSTFKHNNMNSLVRRLNKIDFGIPKLIVTEGVFSMDGDICKLDQIYDIAQKYNAAIMVDDAHATGIIGQSGRGSAEYFGLEGKIDITFGTLSKSIGCIGGFVVANKKIIDYLKHNSRAFLFTTSLPPAIVASIIKAIDIMENRPEIRMNLWKNINWLKTELIDLGFDVRNTQSAIIPIIIKDEVLTYKMTALLEEEGVFVSPVAYPAVKKSESRLRISIMASHTADDLLFLINKMKKIGKKLEII